MKEIQRRQHKAKKAARKAARKVVKIKWEERQQLLHAMFVMGHNYQVHPVYPSNTDDLE
jgi:hypothetical protein